MGWVEGCLDAHAWTGGIPFLWHRPLWPGPVWLSSCRSCSLFHLLVPFLVLMGPNNQDFQGYSIHRASWTTTLTIYFTVQPLLTQFGFSLPHRIWFTYMVSPAYTNLLRSCLPSLSVLGVSRCDSSCCFGMGSTLHCAARSPLHCTTFLISGSWALNAGRSPLLLRQPPNPHNIFPNLPYLCLSNASHSIAALFRRVCNYHLSI